MEGQPPRKLAVILHADVVGSTRLVHGNETLAHQRIQEVFRRLSETIKSYGGISHEQRGDALVAEFDRASDAVAAALAFQAENTQFNSTLDDDIQPYLRMGIAMGEVVIADNTVTGDGVVLAQRLEQLAKSGGVCIQGAAHETVPQRLPFAYESLGEQEVKGYDEPVRAYAVELKRDHTIPRPERHGRRRSKWVVVAAIGLLIVIGGGLAWFQPWVVREEPASIERMAFPLPDEPSIAVLPFDNLSGNSEQDYFVDGISDTLITILARLPNVFVIARNSTFTYRRKPVKVQQVAEDLGVRYVLEGSVQRFGGDVRINAQLIDALSGRHVWAKQYNREVDDIFALQDDIARNVATAMEVELTEGEQARTWRSQTKSADAYDIYARGIQLSRRFTPADNAEAQRAFQKAVALDPNFAAGWVMLAWTFLYEGRFGWSDDSATSWGRAKELAEQALALDESNPDVYELLASVAMHVERNYGKAMTYCEKALSLNPGADVLAGCAGKLNYAGRPDKALPLVERAMRLSPHYPAWYLLYLGNAHRLMRNYDRALQALEAWRDRNPENTGPHIVLAYTYAEMGRIEDAQAEAEEILRRNPEFSLEQQVKQSPYMDPRELQRTLDGLRAAGIPERPPRPLPDKPSIAVLPFTNISGDPEQEYFSDGMTDDIITDLSKLSGLFVIARNSTFAYKGTPIDVKQVARELGVRYVLEGSVRRADDRVRINAQLVDGTTGGHLWADRYDRDYSNIFAIQSEVIAQIVSALQVSLGVNDQVRLAGEPTNNLEAYDLYLRAEEARHSYTWTGLGYALGNYDRAIALDPDFAEAHAGYAQMAAEFLRHPHGFLTLPADVARRRAYASVTQALSLDPQLARAHAVLGVLHMLDGQYDEALESARKAVALNTNSADAYANLALVLTYAGRHAEAIPAMEAALRLEPNPTNNMLVIWGRVLFMNHDYAQALDILPKPAPGNRRNTRLLLAMTHAELGQLEKAGELLQALLGSLGVRWWNLSYFGRLWAHHKQKGELDHQLDALRKAGMPEWPSGYEEVSGERLRGAAIGDLLFGATWMGRSLNQYHLFAQQADEDGNVSYHTLGRSWEGKASVEGDMLCYQIPAMLLGRKFCGAVYRNPGSTPEERNEYVAVDIFDVHYFSLQR